MNNKEKQIEQMAKDIVRMAGLAVYSKAEYLINLGYRKVPEDSVVLTATETAERWVDLLIEFDEMGFTPDTTVPNPDEYARDYKRRLIYATEQLRKKTAEKFVNETTKRKQTLMNPYTDDESECVSTFWIYKLAKQFGVEIRGEE